MKVDLSLYQNNLHQPAGLIKRIVWYYVNLLFFKSGLFPIYKIKIFLLKMFGASIGKNVVIKPSVNIKYPWNLQLGNNVWIGENVWIDNLVKVNIGNNVCISQGAVIINGSHDYKKSTFDLMISPVSIEDCVWICAKSMIFGGTFIEKNVVLSAGSCASGKLEKNGIYRGNPAIRIKERAITD